jgi:replicative DNA helicase
VSTFSLHEKKIKEDLLLPRNEEAEQALLASLLYNNKSYEKISEFLKPEYFSSSIHKKIYSTISFLIEKGEIADPITLHQYFVQEKSLDEIGGTSYITKLSESVISITNTYDYGNTIFDLYIRRELINLGKEIIHDAQEFQIERKATDQIEKIEKRLFDISYNKNKEYNILHFSKALTQAIYSAKKAIKKDSYIVGTTSGLIDLDKQTGGFHNSDLIIVAGRPSMGKTGLATTFAFNAAKSGSNGSKVLFFSLEMSCEQLATRILSQEISIPSDKIRQGNISYDEFPKFIKASRELYDLPLFIDDTPELSISSLRTRARRLKRKHNVGMIIIDYLQLIKNNSKNKSENRVQEISEISRSLKALAKELNVPVIALSQLSRAVEQRDNKRPQLADLRESGSIEQDADVVMFIYREAYYESRKEPLRGTDKHRQWQEYLDKIYREAEVVIAKQRNGPIGTIKLYFKESLVKFDNIINSNIKY